MEITITHEVSRLQYIVIITTYYFTRKKPIPVTLIKEDWTALVVNFYENFWAGTYHLERSKRDPEFDVIRKQVVERYDSMFGGG